MPTMLRAAGYFLSLAVAMLIPGLLHHEAAGLVAAAAAGLIGLALVAWWFVRGRDHADKASAGHE
jgi:hypothetical protein